jgi:hypothetical protein
MSIDSEQTPFRPAQLIAASTIARAIRLAIWRSLGILWRNSETPVWQFLSNPLSWTLIALFVSSIGLYCDLR